MGHRRFVVLGLLLAAVTSFLSVSRTWDRQQPNTPTDSQRRNVTRNTIWVEVRKLPKGQISADAVADHVREQFSELVSEMSTDVISCCHKPTSQSGFQLVDFRRRFPHVSRYFSRRNVVVQLANGSKQARSVVRPSALFDIVIAHVDPDAGNWREQIAKFAAAEGKKIDPARYRASGEIEFVFGSLLAYAAPIIRRVVLVVADEAHAAKVLAVWNRTFDDSSIPIVVVPHSRLFPVADDLPTFNSNAIESVLFRIPNLSPFFFYLNDDMVLGRRLSAYDFLRPRLRVGNASEGLRIRSLPATTRVTNSTLSAINRGFASDPVHLTFATGTDLGYSDSRRLFIEFEPINFAERMSGMESCRMNSTASSYPAASRCRREIACPTSQPRPMVWRGRSQRPLPPPPETFTHFININRERAWNFLGIAPLYSFAHLPRVFDRDLLESTLDTLHAEVIATRQRRFRATADVWVPFLYQHAVAATRGRDVNKDCTLSPNDSALDRAIPPRCRTTPQYPCEGIQPTALDNYVVEKLFGDMLVLDRKPLYFFVMPASTFELRKYTAEIERQVALFVTLNDNFSGSRLSDDVPAGMRKFLVAAVGNITV
jgi:hypothetical protein